MWCQKQGHNKSESKESETKEMKETKAGPKNLRMTLVGGTTGWLEWGC